MSTESTPLAQRLGERLIDGVWLRLDPQGMGFAAGDGPAVEQVIPAVLRELAESGAVVEDFGGDWQEMCRALADSIEKGGEADG